MSANPFRYFRTSPEIIRLAVMLYVRFPLSLRNVEDLLHERGIDVSHETVRYWWNRFGPIFAAEIRHKRARHLRGWPHKGGVTLVQALVRNVETCRPDAKGDIQAGGPCEDQSTDAGHRGGATRSSDEGPVMGLERRGCVVQLWTEVNRQREEPHG